MHSKRRMPMMHILVNIFFVSGVMVCSGFFSFATAFIVPAKSSILSSPPRPLTVTKIIMTRHARTRIFYRDNEENSPVDAIVNIPPTATRDSGKDNNNMKRITLQRKTDTKPSRRRNTISVTSLDEFASVIEEGRRDGKVVVVRFHANWCKKCHTLRPSFDKLASIYDQITFVDVPILETNINLHQGLGVQTVPYGHIYHPTDGLVVETKLSRQSLGEFVNLMLIHSRTTPS